MVKAQEVFSDGGVGGGAHHTQAKRKEPLICARKENSAIKIQTPKSL